jgi:hypothetical protein
MRLIYIDGAFTKRRAQGEIEVTNPATDGTVGADFLIWFRENS